MVTQKIEAGQDYFHLDRIQIDSTQTKKKAHSPPTWVKLLVVGVGIAAIAAATSYLLNLPSAAAAEAVPKTAQKLKLPRYLASYMNNGVQLLPEGNAGCEYWRDGLVDIEECEENVWHAERLIKEIGAKDKVYTKAVFNEKGSPVAFPYQGVRWVMVGLNPEKKACYERALEKAEKVILNNPSFFQQNSTAILGSFKDIMRTIMAYTREAVEMHKRDDVVVFYDETKVHNSGELYQSLRDAGATQNDLMIFESSLEQAREGTLNFTRLTSEEKRVWSLIAYIAPSSQEIPARLEFFVRELKTRLFGKEEPVSLASWAHCEWGRMKPYVDGDGRFARLLLNVLLVLGGKKPVVFPNDEEYTQAIIADGKQQGSFAEYMADTVIPWNKEARDILVNT